jgi:N-acetylmuramoyl-L-alanine amidase
MYTRAMAEERAVRAESSRPTLKQIHHAIASYEAIVRRHPASGYCDNALWQGGNLALLAFDRYHIDADQQKATRLFTMLIKEYPTSKLVKSAREVLAPAPAAAATSGADRDAPRPAESPAKTPPHTPSAVTTLKDVHRTELPDGIRVTVDFDADAEVAYHQEEIPDPRRLFFDLKGVKAAPNLQDVTLRFDGDIVRLVRLGRHPQNTTRLVVDLDGVAGYSVYPLYSPYRLVIDLQRPAALPGHEATLPAHAATLPAPDAVSAAKPFAKPFKAPALRVEAKAPSAGIPITEIKLPAQPPPAPLPVVAVTPQPQIFVSSEPAPPPTKQADPGTASPIAPAANSNGKFSLSRQLGLGVSRIVIDAGHGGHDPGAQGSGINEAELTLDVALRLQKLLEKQPGFEVVMTRDSDEFIPLQERTAIANREGADLFLSIHANASRNPQARGIETYFLNFAMNPEAEAVAARENAASGQAMHSLPDIVKAIALNNKINESRDFAATVQKSMVKRLGTKNHTVKDLGVKQAPFVVLIGASMPSVLAEISFVTNKQDGTLLKTQAYRQQIAQALFEAIQNYQQALNRINPATGKKATAQ